MKRYINLILIIAVVAWNYFATSLPLNDKTLAVLLRKYNTLINPASYAYSIWTLIHFGLLAFALYQVLPSKRNKKVIDEIAPFLWLNLVALGAWWGFLHFELIWSGFIAMLTVVGTLIYINLEIYERGKSVANWVKWTFHIYFGWATFSVVVNFSSCLDTLNGEDLLGMADRSWYYLMLALVALVTFFVLQKLKAFCFSATIVWALVAVALDQPGTRDGLFYVPLTLAALIMIHAVIGEMRDNKRLVY